MNLKRNLLTIAIASSLAACGGGGGGSSASSSGTVGGSVVKGIVVGGKVTAKDAAGTVVGTATTDANGEYSITLDPAYTGGPLKIEIEGQDGATMKCDVVGGCDPDKNPATTNFAFGETFPLTSKFKLKAVVADATGTVSTHVTALTDMAAKLAEKNAGTGNPLNADAINGANSQVAQLFGLSSGDDLIQEKPIDITNPAVIATATAAQLRNALYSAAILGAVLKSTSGSDDFSDDLEAFSNKFADDSGQLPANDANTATTSLSEVLLEADSLLKEDTVSGAISSVDSSIGSKITADKADADSKPVDELTTSSPSPEAASSDVRKALAMISDLRDLAYALGARQNNAASTDAQALVGGVDAFANELSIAGDAAGPGAQYLVKALGMAAVAMAQAGAAYADAVDQELVDPPASIDVSGIQVTITPNIANPLDVTLTVAETDLNVDSSYAGTDGINVVDLALSFSLALTGVQEAIDSLAIVYGTASGGNPSAQETGTGTLTLNANLAGTVTGPTSMLSILDTEAKPSSVRVDVQQFAFSDLRTEQALITVDGSADDWNTDGSPWWNWSDSITDPEGDNTGGAGTDITALLYRSSDQQLAFGILLTDDPVFPHTDPELHPHSRYDVGMVLYKDDSCSDQLGSLAGEPWFTSVRNVTQNGITFSEVKTFDINDDPVGEATALTSTSSGEMIELLMPQSALPNGANSVLAQARVRWYDADGTRDNLDRTDQSVCIALRSGDSYVQDSFAGTWGIQPSSISLDLNAKLEQQGVDPAAMFEGGLSASLTGLDYDGTDADERTLTSADNGTTFTESNSFTLSETLSFTALNMTLSGSFSRGDNSFAAFFDATIGGTGFSATFEEDDDWSTTYDADGNWLSNAGTGFTSTSSTTGFVTLDAMLRFDAIINGISNSPVMVQLDLSRSTETTGSAGLRITQGSAGKFMEVATQLAQGADSANPDDVVATSAVFSNQDGITIDLLDADTTDTGKITIGAGDSLKQLGTVTETNDTLIFRLNDGSINRIESL